MKTKAAGEKVFGDKGSQKGLVFYVNVEHREKE